MEVRMFFDLKDSACISCGKCANTCPFLLLSMEDGKPFMPAENEAACVECQHCMAVCPTSAITLNGANPENSISLKHFSPNVDNIDLLLKSRRSCRNFKEKDVDTETLNRILDVTAYAPTGKNEMSVTFTVIDNSTDMEKFKTKAKAKLKEVLDNRADYDLPAYLFDYITMWIEGGVNIFFRNAPHMFVSSNPKSAITPDHDGIIAATFFDIAANTHGVGVCWNHIVKFLIEHLAPEMKCDLGIPEDHTIGAVMTFGYPATVHHRIPQRKPSRINRVALS
jgi:nitroreductase/NAD-dependent dihydropyrimidine dehydrogenase PreA subunit